MSKVLILGAASDMAVAIAREFAGKGYGIQLAARNPQRLHALQSDIIIRYKVECTVHEFDAFKFESHHDFFYSLPEKPDITVCVFGYLGDNEKARTDWNEAVTIINSNYTGAVSILNIVSAYYQQQKSGVIVGISSVAGERGRQSNYVYGSAKAGFTAYLSGLRNRMFHENVHVLSVQPGFVYTRMTSELKLPALLTAKPEEVGSAVYAGVKNRKNVIYVRWFWRWIMLIIRCVPEFIFKKMKL